MIKNVSRTLAGITAGFFYLISFLQMQDGFVGYGFVSIGIGTTILGLTFGTKLIAREPLG